MHDISKRSAHDSHPSIALARLTSERLQGAAFILLLLLGAWQGFSAFANQAAQRRMASVKTISAFLSGRTAATINYIEAHYLPADHVLRAAGAEFRWLIFGSGGPQVSVGNDDWLFLTSEGRTYDHARTTLEERADIVANVATAMRRRGIELVIVVVPDKERVASRFLGRTPRSAQSIDRLPFFLASLRDRRLTVIDVATILGDVQASPLFYRTDTHWNQAGAALAAQAVARAVKTTLSPGYSYRTDRADVETDGPGDLLRLSSLDLLPNAVPLLGLRLRPRPDRQFLERTVKTQRPPESTDLLAPTPGDEVVLLGSSYSKNANFHGRLEEDLRAPVNNVAEAGGGFAGSARSYLRSSSFADMPPKVILWEMPERALTAPLEDADRDLASFR